MVQAIEQLEMKETDPYLAKFERFENETKQPSWVFPMRKAGISRFVELGFPTLQQEDWRFTNVAPIAKLPFKPLFQASPRAPTPDAVARFTLARLDACRLVFVDGHFAAALSSPGLLQQGLVAGSLAAALASDSDLVQKHLFRQADSETNPFTALNTAFFQDGAFVHVPAGKLVETPIHLLFISTSGESGAASHPRNLILVGKGSRVTLLETYASTVDSSYFTNAVTEIVVEEGAVVEHVKFQDEGPGAFHMAAIHAHLGPRCDFISHSIAAGARLSRNNIRTNLAGEGVQCVLNGLYLMRGDQLADHHMVVEHAQPHCSSHEFYNGILEDRSKGVFHGRILVRQAAQKTDAKQTNKNLLLSEEATIDTKPQLEIYADDVKCTHGATVGQLSDEAIFYLRTRGLGKQTARHMLIHAFAGEIVERIRHRPAREELNRFVWERLEANPRVGAKK